MPVIFDYPLTQHSDGVVTIGLENPVAIGGWNIRTTVLKRFGGVSGIIVRSTASGIASGASGMAILNSGQGTFAVEIRSADFSGRDYGAYAMVVERLDSGHRTMLCEGSLLNMP